MDNTTAKGLSSIETGQGLVFGMRRSSAVEHIRFDVQSLADGYHVGPKESKQPYRFFIKTYGCQMNEHDSETMAGLLLAMGLKAAETIDDADVILFNTCAVREHAEDRVFSEIGRLRPLKAANPELILGLCGCMAQEKGVQKLVQEKFPWIDLVFGTHNIHRLPQLLTMAIHSQDTVMEVWDRAASTVENIPKSRKDKVRAWVNIQYGCNKFCTYCVVPYTRGAERSRLPDDIVTEVEQLVDAGFREVTLLGQNVNDYGVDLGTINFAELLRRVDRISGIERVRFMTSNPWNFTDELIEAIAQCPHVAEHVHLPAQSGNNDVLRRMNRTYTRELYLKLAAKIRNNVKNVSLTTDIIVGFPGETEAQFEDTMRLVEEMQYDNVYSFIYSPRENTPAARFSDTAGVLQKKARLERLNNLQYGISLRHNQALTGRVVEVLVEGESKNNASIMAGRTRTNKLVLFKGSHDLTGRLVQVKVAEPQTWLLKGELVETLKEALS